MKFKKDDYFVKHYNFIGQDRRLNIVDIYIINYILSWGEKVYVSSTEIGKNVNCSRSTVERSLSKLEKYGYIYKENESRRRRTIEIKKGVIEELNEEYREWETNTETK